MLIKLKTRIDGNVEDHDDNVKPGLSIPAFAHATFSGGVPKEFTEAHLAKHKAQDIQPQLFTVFILQVRMFVMKSVDNWGRFYLSFFAYFGRLQQPCI